MVNVMGTAMGMVKKEEVDIWQSILSRTMTRSFQLYRLAFPNDEVRYGFLKGI